MLLSPLRTVPRSVRLKRHLRGQVRGERRKGGPAVLGPRLKEPSPACPSQASQHLSLSAARLAQQGAGGGTGPERFQIRLAEGGAPPGQLAVGRQGQVLREGFPCLCSCRFVLSFPEAAPIDGRDL